MILNRLDEMAERMAKMERQKAAPSGVADGEAENGGMLASLQSRLDAFRGVVETDSEPHRYLVSFLGAARAFYSARPLPRP